MFNPVYLFYHCLIVYVYLCLPMFTHGLPMLALLYLSLPQFIRVYLFLLVLPKLTHV